MLFTLSLVNTCSTEPHVLSMTISALREIYMAFILGYAF